MLFFKRPKERGFVLGSRPLRLKTGGAYRSVFGFLVARERRAEGAGTERKYGASIVTWNRGAGLNVDDILPVHYPIPYCVT